MFPQDCITIFSAKLHVSEEEMEELSRLLPNVDDWDKAAKNLIERGLGPLFYHKIDR